MKRFIESAFWTKQKVVSVLGTLVIVLSTIGGFLGIQSYMENKYAENEDVDHICQMFEEDIQILKDLDKDRQREIGKIKSQLNEIDRSIGKLNNKVF